MIQDVHRIFDTARFNVCVGNLVYRTTRWAVIVHKVLYDIEKAAFLAARRYAAIGILIKIRAKQFREDRRLWEQSVRRLPQ